MSYGRALRFFTLREIFFDPHVNNFSNQGKRQG